MASVTVDVYLDEFDLDELLNEIEDRYNSNYCKSSDKQEIDDWAKDLFEIERFNNIRLSMLDQMKIDFLMQNLDRIKLNDLENLI
jgi:uncharacterized protein YlbG (UPF0298 family)